MTGPPTPEPAGTGPLPPEAFDRWYGGWDPLVPATIGEFMSGFERPWWVIGGWTIEVFTGVRREHKDMDISMFASDAEAFREFLPEETVRRQNHRFGDAGDASGGGVSRGGHDGGPWAHAVGW